MIAVDTNILVYADRAELPKHEKARAALGKLAEGARPWALPVFCIGEYLRVVSHPRLFRPPSPVTDGLEQLEALLASPSVRLLSPGPRYFEIFRQTVSESGAEGNDVFDAQIAAVCLEWGATTILTDDRDFAHFANIRVERL